MEVLLNCTTLVKGGALQAAVSFIRTSLTAADHITWHYMVSRKLWNELQEAGHVPNARYVSVIDESPAKSRSSRKRIRRLVTEMAPDLVFTFFGPAYVEFKVPHLCGVADGWVTHGDRWAWRTVRNPMDAAKLIIAIAYKGMMFRRADAWVTESMTAKEGLMRRLRLPEGRVSIVPNSCASHYLQSETACESQPREHSLKILCLSAYYRHKNLEIIPDVAKALKEFIPNRDVQFILTLPGDCCGLKRVQGRATALGVDDRIVNVGPIPVSRGPELYRTSHIMFLPSVLETFSANYPEAMAMGIPIVTTDLGFAREICGAAASYYTPMDANAAARAISEICHNQELWRALVSNGKRVLRTLPTQETKYELYKNCIYELSRQTSNRSESVVIS